LPSPFSIGRILFFLLLDVVCFSISGFDLQRIMFVPACFPMKLIIGIPAENISQYVRV